MQESTNAPTFRNPTASEIPSLIDELMESGLKISAFAREKGLKPQKLYLAQRKREATTAVIFDSIHVDTEGCS